MALWNTLNNLPGEIHAQQEGQMGSRRLAGSLTRLLAALAAAALALALFGCARQARRPERRHSTPTSPAEQALVDLADRYADLDSFSERTRITRTVSSADGDEVATYQTQLFFSRPNRILYRSANDDTTVIACNGRRLIVYSSAENGYVERDPPEDLAAFVRDHRAETIGVDELLLLAGGDPLAALEKATITENQSLNDRPVRVIEAGLKELGQRGAEEPAAGAQSFWIGEDGLIHRAALKVERGGAALRVEEVMEDLAPNPALSDDLFDYQPPKEAKNLTPEQPPA